MARRARGAFAAPAAPPRGAASRLQRRLVDVARVDEVGDEPGLGQQLAPARAGAGEDERGRVGSRRAALNGPPRRGTRNAWPPRRVFTAAFQPETAMSARPRQRPRRPGPAEIFDEDNITEGDGHAHLRHGARRLDVTSAVGDDDDFDGRGRRRLRSGRGRRGGTGDACWRRTTASMSRAPCPATTRTW